MLRKVLGVARAEYRGFIVGKRPLFMLFAFIFMMEDVVGKMGELGLEYGYAIGRTEPFILLLSYRIHAMLFPVVFVVMMSDFPSNEKSGYFIMSRISRLSWLAGELLYACMAGLTLIFFVLFGSMLWVWKASGFMDGWSPYMTGLYVENPDVYALNNQLFIRTGTLAQGRPAEVMAHSICLMALYLFFLALLLALFKLIHRKYLGVFLAVSVTVAGVAAGETESVLKWLFPINQCMFESHFKDYFSDARLELAYSYLYFLGLILVLAVVDVFLARCYNICEEGEA